MTSEYRIEHDTMGEVRVPVDALYRAQTQRAVENFPISGSRLERSHIEALARIKKAAARANAELGHEHVRHTVQMLQGYSKSLAEAVAEGRCAILGVEYTLADGRAQVTESVGPVEV